MPQNWAGWQAVRPVIQVEYSAAGQKPEKEGNESVTSEEVSRFTSPLSELLRPAVLVNRQALKCQKLHNKRSLKYAKLCILSKYL